MIHKIDVNVHSIGLVGESGSGKSYTWEKVLFPKLAKPMLIIDPKNQYGHLSRQGWDNYVISGNDPYKQYITTLKVIKLKFVKSKHHFIIRWVPGDIIEEDFNAIIGHWTQIGGKHTNNVTVLEEAPYYKESIFRPYKEFERTLRLRQGLHNLNSNVIWITQFPNDMPTAIIGNTSFLFVFKHWESQIEKMYNNRTIPDKLTFNKIIGKKPDGSPVFNYHVIGH